MFMQSVFCFVPSRASAERIIHDLQRADFSSTEVGALFFDRRADLGGDAPASSIAGAPCGGRIAGKVAWIAGIGQLAVPGVGVFNAAGLIIGAIHQARTLKPGVPIADGLIHLGVAREIALRDERRIKAGGWLMLAVHTSNSSQAVRARAIFAVANAHDICTTRSARMRHRAARPDANAKLALRAA